MPRPVRILLTGFVPFGGSRVNPSWEAVRRLRRARISGVRVSVARLPVVWGEAERRLVAAILHCRPDVVICVGQSSGRAWVSVESRAVNRREGRDAKGRRPRTAKMWERPSLRRRSGQAGRDVSKRKSPKSLPSTLPIRRILAALLRAGIPARRSRDAGRYLCNAVMYTACRTVGRTFRLRPSGYVGQAGPCPGDGCRGRKPAPTAFAGFIHVPMLPGQVQSPKSKVQSRFGPRKEPVLPLATIVRAVRLAVVETARTLRIAGRRAEVKVV